jgi:dienelactone hydrolase
MRRLLFPLLLAVCAFAQQPPEQAKEFVAALVRGDFPQAATNFDDKLKDLMPADRLEAAWKALLAESGEFVDQFGVREEKLGPYNIVYVACHFENNPIDVKVVYNSSSQVSGLFFAPHYDPSEDKLPATVIETPADINGLPGTLTTPKGLGPFPGLILVHGSGPNDRDETMGSNKPFRDLAWGLASRGVVVLRYEKRTKTHPEQFAGKSFTVRDETINDAVTAVGLLRKTGGVDFGRVFVLGHSLGGMLIPRIAKTDREIAGCIILAGSTRPLQEITLEQLEYLKSDKLDYYKEQAARIPNLKPTDDPVLGAPASYWIDLRGYDPAAMAKDLKIPLLILQGERDYQVTMKDFDGWHAALAGRPNVTFKTYPGLNHAFTPGEGVSSPAEYQIPGHVPDDVLDDIATWIKSERPAPVEPAQPAKGAASHAK